MKTTFSNKIDKKHFFMKFLYLKKNNFDVNFNYFFFLISLINIYKIFNFPFSQDLSAFFNLYEKKKKL